MLSPNSILLLETLFLFLCSGKRLLRLWVVGIETIEMFLQLIIHHNLARR